MKVIMQFRNVHEIKKATKAVNKLAKAIEKVTIRSEEAISTMNDFKESLPILEEVK